MVLSLCRKERGNAEEARGAQTPLRGPFQFAFQLAAKQQGRLISHVAGRVAKGRAGEEGKESCGNPCEVPPLDKLSGH